MLILKDIRDIIRYNIKMFPRTGPIWILLVVVLVCVYMAFVPNEQVMQNHNNNLLSLFKKFILNATQNWIMHACVLIMIVQQAFKPEKIFPKEILWKELVIIAWAMFWISWSAARGFIHVATNPYDFGVYWQAAHGIFPFSMEQGFWVYNDKIAVIFKWMTYIDIEMSWIIFYAVIATCTNVLFYLTATSWRYRNLGFIVAMISLPLFSVSLKTGNIQGLLVLLAIHPIGAILASCVKPYFLVYALLHMAVIVYKRRRVV